MNDNDKPGAPPKKSGRRRAKATSKTAGAVPALAKPEPAAGQTGQERSAKSDRNPAPATAATRRKRSSAKRPKQTADAAVIPAETATPASEFSPPAAPTLAAGEASNPPPQDPPKLLLSTRLDVRWGDMDAFNHVNNARFLSYLEEARLRWLQGLSGPWLDDNIAPVLAAANINYRRPIEWPQTLAIELYANRVGSSSLSIGHRIVASDDSDIEYCDGHVVMVWIDRRSGKGSKLPEAVRAAAGA